MAKKKSRKFKVYGSPVKHPSKMIVKTSSLKKKKKLKIKANSIPPDGPSSSSMFVSNVNTTTIVATPSTIVNDSEATLGRKKEKENIRQTPGYIFMCNGKTKPECYQNRVFGLPRGQLEIVEKIKLGSKLFLFDFELRLLYGVYKATSKGELGLEPAAFNGKFPAQVRFKIFKECLPLMEKAFKHAIKDNYHGSKFRQDLTSKQVKTLISLFRPITRPTSATSVSTLTNVVRPHTFAAQLPARLTLYGDSCLPTLHHVHALPVPVSQSERVIAQLPYDQHGSDMHLGRVRPPIEVRHIMQPAAVPYRSELHYLTEVHQPNMPGKPSSSVQDPYGRYSHTLEGVQRDRIAGLESEYQTLQLTRKIEIIHPPENAVSYYSQNLPPASATLVSSQTNAGEEMLSSYQPHYPVKSNQDLSQAYVNPLQRPVTGRSSLVVASLSMHPQGELLSSYQPHCPATSKADPLQRSVSGRSSLVEASWSTHAQGGLSSSYQPCYPVASNENPRCTYANPLRWPLCGSSSSAEVSFSVSSIYTLPGAAPNYR